MSIYNRGQPHHDLLNAGTPSTAFHKDRTTIGLISWKVLSHFQPVIPNT